jgi:hypothetical protein
MRENYSRMIKLEQLFGRESGPPTLDGIEVARDLAHKGTRALIDPIELVKGQKAPRRFSIARTLRRVGLRRSHRKRLDLQLSLADRAPIGPSLLIALKSNQCSFSPLDHRIGGAGRRKVCIANLVLDRSRPNGGKTDDVVLISVGKVAICHGG